jgi:hypothetical protein
VGTSLEVVVLDVPISVPAAVEDVGLVSLPVLDAGVMSMVDAVVDAFHALLDLVIGQGMS